MRDQRAFPCRQDQLRGIWNRGAAARLEGRCVLLRAFCFVLAPAAVSIVIAAGHNKRLQKMAFAFGGVSAARSRGCASIVRLRAAMAS